VPLLAQIARVLEDLRASLERIELSQENANAFLASIERSQYS
jgi:hypothetical protein